MRDIAIDQLLHPIPGDAPAGCDLRYTDVYEELMEARRHEEALAMGDWRHDVKKANWDKVISLAVTALSTKSKDLQIAVWLTEALTVTEGFSGLHLGLQLLTALTDRFWDTTFPQTEGGDLEYRATPFQFLNNKVTLHVRQLPITDPEATPGYSWLKWHQSCEVGAESDLKNRYGEIDEERKIRRDGLLAEAAVSAEQFDSAAELSKGAWGDWLRSEVGRCGEHLDRLTQVLEQRFHGAAPSLSELAAVIEGCSVVVHKLYGEPAGQQSVAVQPEAPESGKALAAEGAVVAEGADPAQLPLSMPTAEAESELPEQALWKDAVSLLEAGRLEEALAMLLCSGNGSGSVRERCRIRLLMGKLCLKAGRPDLARPIIEELHGLMEALQLERWESPLWIAEVLEAYYRCLQAGGLRECDLELSQALFRRICSLDVTKALPFRV